MPNRRVLSLWFPRLGSERLLRRQGTVLPAPFATVAERAGARVVDCISPEAAAEGVARGMGLGQARALCPGLRTAPADPAAEVAFLSALARWAARFSPWVAEAPPDGVTLDVTGCAHLFGGEATLLARIVEDCADMGVTARAGLADTVGGAWALARHAGRVPAPAGPGANAVAQEARATRARAAPLPRPTPEVVPAGARVAPPGRTAAAIADLPLTALRLPPEAVSTLAAVGLARVGELADQPRAPLARRFGQPVLARLDQALGRVPEPVCPATPPPRFAVRLTLPEPIGLVPQIEAALDRLLPALCARLRQAGHGARTVRLEGRRVDHGTTCVEVVLAQATDAPERVRTVLSLRLDALKADFGIDALRLVATVTEPLSTRTHSGHLDAVRTAPEPLADLIGRMGARIGLERVTRDRPAESHLPERTFRTEAAIGAQPEVGWPRGGPPRPLFLWPPEPVTAPTSPAPPARVHWRGRTLHLVHADGPERIAPEWWRDDPNWRTGVRDYWVATCAEGDRLWLYYAHGGVRPGGWYCHGSFG